MLGAGMVGTSTALQLARRGHAVVLVDRHEPGRETSFGNAGILQREAVEPPAFPRQWSALRQAALRRGTDVHYQFAALPTLLPHLWRYWTASAPARYRAIAAEYGRLIEHSRSEHETLIAECGAGELVRKDGYLQAFRTHVRFDAGAARAQRLSQAQGLAMRLLDGAGVRRAEPGLHGALAGAVHWLDPWSISDPGELVTRYARRFIALGGRVVQGDAASLQALAPGWQVQTRDGAVQAPNAVIALGPWSMALVRRIGYRWPLFLKRGYHRHFTGGPGLQRPLLDAERGCVLAPTSQGMRLTTGAEFARLDDPASPVPMAKATRAARELLDLPEAVEAVPWLGSRPCTADMKPVIGPAPRERGLWFNVCHAHHGFTLGPVSARLLADLIEGERPIVDPAPYLPGRF